MTTADVIELLRIEALRLWSATGIVFRCFDYAATFAWALSGAVLGARRGYDLTGIFALAMVSSCGGGLLRDAVFLQAGPPVMVQSPAYVLIAFTASIVTWLAGIRLLTSWRRIVVSGAGIADALGLGAFAVVGTRLALSASIGVAGAILIGVVNAVGGGLLQAVIVRQVPEVLRPGKFTAMAAFSGALLYATLALALRVDERAAGAATIAIVAGMRWASVRYRLHTRAAWSLTSRQSLRDRARPQVADGGASSSLMRAAPASPVETPPIPAAMDTKWDCKTEQSARSLECERRESRASVALRPNSSAASSD